MCLGWLTYSLACLANWDPPITIRNRDEVALKMWLGLNLNSLQTADTGSKELKIVNTLFATGLCSWRDT